MKSMGTKTFEKVLVFVMRNEGTYDFVNITPSYIYICDLLGIGENASYDIESIRLGKKHFDMFTDTERYRSAYAVTGYNADKSRWIIGAFVLGKRDKNNNMIPLSKSDMTAIEDNIRVTCNRYVNVLGIRHYVNSFILSAEFD